MLMAETSSSQGGAGNLSNINMAVVVWLAAWPLATCRGLYIRIHSMNTIVILHIIFSGINRIYILFKIYRYSNFSKVCKDIFTFLTFYV